MKLLAVSDKEDPFLWSAQGKEILKGTDLILSCGDLDPDYLQFLVTYANCPLYYVHGNHDKTYKTNPPHGCICIDGRIVDYKGLRILGLGGSMRYDPEGTLMYTEEEMASRIRRKKPAIHLMNGVDVILTHAPAKGYGDLPDLPHQGFECFNDLLEQFHPFYLFYGHIHQEYGMIQRLLEHPSGTRLINAYRSYETEISSDDYPAVGHTGSFLYDLYQSRGKSR